MRQTFGESATGSKEGRKDKERRRRLTLLNSAKKE
jgi:hypothetical protein